MENKELMDKQAVDNSPAGMIRSAITGGADLAQLEQLLSLQERWEAGEAKKAYHRAMTAFKLNPPTIEKDKKVAFGNTKYNHASLANVTEKINTELSKHGLSASWDIVQNGAISVTCKITHQQGHSESTTITAPADNSGSKNAIQSIGSTISYLSRYSLLCILGLATSEQDDDGKASGHELISDAEKNEILDKVLSTNSNLDKFLEYMKIGKIEDIPKSDLKKARIALENAASRKLGKK